jgi:hypothetical protein
MRLGISQSDRINPIGKGFHVVTACNRHALARTYSTDRQGLTATNGALLEALKLRA